MNQMEIRRAAGLEEDWHVVWEGVHPFETADHLCAGPYGPGGTYQTEWLSLPYGPGPVLGVEVARCERCRMAWVKGALEGAGAARARRPRPWGLEGRHPRASSRETGKGGMLRRALARIGLARGERRGASGALLAELRRGKEQGTGQVYPITVEQAWTIAKAVLHSARAEVIEEHPEEGYLLASSGADLVSYGAFMAAWAEPAPDDATKVTVVIRRRVEATPFVPLTEAVFHIRFAQAVEAMKVGRPLPHKPPA